MPNNRHLTWVVVADNCQAKIYRLIKFPKIEEIAHFEHPESRLHNQELVSSKQGRCFQSVGNARSAYQQETEPKVIEAMKFAAEVGNTLCAAERNGEFQRLYVFAEPSFLGLLRQYFSPGLQKAIIAEVPKDLTAFNVAAIEHQLAEVTA